MELLQHSNQDRFTKYIDNELETNDKLDDLKNILLELKSRKNELFKSLDNETRKFCDKLIEYSLQFKSDDRILKLVDQVFDNSQIYIPGSVGSFVVNCVFNQKKGNNSVNEEEKYSQCNFLFYHKFGSKELFTPLRIEKENKRLIILLRNEDKRSFNLEHNKDKLKIFGVNSLDQVEVMIYNPNSYNIDHNQNDRVTKSKELPKKEKSIVLSILLVVVLIAVVFVIYLISK